MVDDPTSTALVRTLINDDHATPAENVFSDVELERLLFLEGGNVKLAAAQALDVIADNEALTSKVIRTQGGVSTDGAKVADAIRKRATALREQALNEDDGYFEIVPMNGPTVTPELTEQPWWP